MRPLSSICHCLLTRLWMILPSARVPLSQIFVHPHTDPGCSYTMRPELIYLHDDSSPARVLMVVIDMRCNVSKSPGTIRSMSLLSFLSSPSPPHILQLFQKDLLSPFTCSQRSCSSSPTRCQETGQRRCPSRRPASCSTRRQVQFACGTWRDACGASQCCRLNVE